MDAHYALGSPSKENVIAPRLFISSAALVRLAAYVRLQPTTEVCGYGFVSSWNGDFYVANPDDFFITEQVVTSSSAKDAGAGLGPAYAQAVVEGRDSQLRLQWHSHPGDAYFSSTDMRNVKEFGNTFDYLISVVTNRWGNIQARFDTFQPWRFGAEMEVFCYDDIDEETRRLVSAELRRKVTVVPTKKNLTQWRPA